MSSPELLLRQRYAVSFLTTTLLIALTTQSSLAFSINTLKSGTPVEDWDTEQRYTLSDQRKGITTLGPLTSLTKGGSPSFLRTLKQSFPSWIFNSVANDLKGSFDVSVYDAVGGPRAAGAALLLKYKPGAGDPTPQSNSLHWIQRVFSNHKLPELPGMDNHNQFEDTIDIGSGVTNPFFDTLTDEEIRQGKTPVEEGVFADLSLREASRDHTWVAELYLVEQTAPQQVTIYNGIRWDWGNKVEPVPEPLTIFASGISLGFGVLFKKTLKGTEESKKK